MGASTSTTVAAVVNSAFPQALKGPLCANKLPDWLLRILANHWDRLGRGNVVTRTPVFISRDGVEVLLDNLLSTRQPVTPARGGIMAWTAA